ncbi:AcrR family transcriptional regulator [Crossiella equi]|uniref:AcrR family transcriptional regulator n=1 Tax=Crossiella equi TaxID=130796 RepID=A0ABS5A8G6_9PSEU|nr:TetR/AcrR family transcriptional regulator [Crossiella equi]MBP2471985.1 AcrR family transcriptional regulator [Crossiella equi]
MTTEQTRPRGRPRDPEIEDAVLRATMHRLVTDGYTRMSLADIASDAGTTRPTLYRRWPGKAELVSAVLAYAWRERRASMPEPDLSQGPEEAVRALVRWLHAPAHPTSAEVDLIGALFTETKHHPELGALCRDQWLLPRKQHLAALLTTLRDEGALRADLDVDMAVSVLLGCGVGHRVYHGSLPEGFADQVVDLLWPALARPALSG